MTKQDYINYWLSTAKEDLETAFSLFDSEKYVWSLFIALMLWKNYLKPLGLEITNLTFHPKLMF